MRLQKATNRAMFDIAQGHPAHTGMQQSAINIDHADHVDDVESGDAGPESEHPAKSQKPN
jgi:hypothetical protein